MIHHNIVTFIEYNLLHFLKYSDLFELKNVILTLRRFRTTRFLQALPFSKLVFKVPKVYSISETRFGNNKYNNFRYKIKTRSFVTLKKDSFNLSAPIYKQCRTVLYLYINSNAIYNC